ncbi:hypothetical protein ACROYT_G025050 [Oculina patagonica]
MMKRNKRSTQPDHFSPGRHPHPTMGVNKEMQTISTNRAGCQTHLRRNTFWEAHQDDKPAMIDRAKDFIKRKFPKVNFAKLGPIGFSKKSGNETTIVSFGSKGGETEIFKKDGTGLLKKFTNKFKAPLGPEAESLIAQDNEEIREMRPRLREAESQIQQAETIDMQKEKATQEVEDFRIRIERIDAKMEQLAKQKAEEQTRVDQLRASLAAIESRRNTLQERLNDTRALDDLKEKEAELKQQNEEDQAVIEDENASPTDKQAAEERVAERTEELGRLQTQIAERERALPLRERIKEIFKKHGVTLTAILLAAGVTIGSVIGAITNALKATGKALGKGLSDIGSKVASALPGLIGSIAKFLFKTAGKVIGFLAEHTWLLILAVVAFLVEKYIKKRR